MIRVFLGLWMLLLAGPAMALELCDELWFARNLVFDQAGYCFTSPLSKAMFNNADCTTSTPVLSAEDQAFVAWVKDTESEWECAVDTAQTRLQVQLANVQRRLTDRVAPSPYESACIGWSGPRIALYAGHSPLSAVIGYADAGMDIHWEYEWLNAPEGWAFLTAKSRDGITYTMGWSNATIAPAHCEMMAG